MDHDHGKGPSDPLLAQKAEQFRHTQQNFAGRTKVGYESNYFHDYFREIPFLRVRALLNSVGRTLDGHRVLVASCGSGIDVHYLRKSYPNAIFHVGDYAQNAVEIAKRSLGVDRGASRTTSTSHSRTTSSITRSSQRRYTTFRGRSSAFTSSCGSRRRA